MTEVGRVRYEWVLLDADGTVFDYDAAEAHALDATLSDVGISLDETVLAAYQRINRELWRAYERGEVTSYRIRVQRWVDLLDHLDAAHDAEELADAYIRHLGEAAQLLDGAREAVAWLGERARVGMITNGLSDVQRSRLQLSGLEPAFEVVVISDEVGASKPDAAYFEAAFDAMAEVAGAPPDPARCLVVGDNVVADIGGGAQAGCDTCWISPEVAEAPDGVAPTYTVASLADLPPLLAD